MFKIFLSISLCFLLTSISFAQRLTVNESNDDHVIVTIDFSNSYVIRDTTIENSKYQYILSSNPILREPGEPAVPSYNFNIGIPPNSKPAAKILSGKKELIKGVFLLPFSIEVMELNPEQSSILFSPSIYSNSIFFPSEIVSPSDPYTMRFAHVCNISVSPFQFNPVTRELNFYRQISIKVDFKTTETTNPVTPRSDKMTEDYLKTSVINSNIAVKWQSQYREFQTSKFSDTYWYDSNKEYYKIFIDSIDLYRVTYEELQASGYSAANVHQNNLELYCNGDKIAIEVFAGEDSLFGTGDYFQFFGEPAKATENARLNIYNNENVYWFSYQADSAYHYTFRDGFPNANFQKHFGTASKVVHYEEDHLYERFGYGVDINRDFWQWGVCSGDSGVFRKVFSESFSGLKDFDQNSTEFKIRVNMHGMTTGQHHAVVNFTSKPMAETAWSGQTEWTFEKTLRIDTISIFPQNNIQIVADGRYLGVNFSDEIRVNWFELEYPRVNRAHGDNYYFTSPQNETGRIRFGVTYWEGSDLKIYIPERGELITNPEILNNEFQGTLFVDSLSEQTFYFCASSSYFKSPLLIVKNDNSDLRNSSNGADYILLTHPDFISSANDLAAFRTSNLAGFENPRVKIVNIFDVYNEFSYGLLSPDGIKDFVKYTFENWSGDAPSYLAILGDMSWDYRQLLESSRPNFIPSYPYHSTRYGLAASDNMFGAVLGDDVIPDISIGRVSCETVEEASILIDKIVNYPNDNTKYWKQNILLIGGGADLRDEQKFGFNDQCLILDTAYIEPAGYTAEKIFTYPDSVELLQYGGNTPEIRDAFTRGTVFANFFGHGGGYQWDNVFLNDDISLLYNESRFPFISSITCYTAHFDNQDVFGEQFNKIPGKGSIGFWGHTGITFWAYGLDLNKKLYKSVFTDEVFVIGDAIRIAKATNSAVQQKLVRDHIALLSLLGEPALELALPKYPDFYVNASDISILPKSPLIEDSVEVKINLHNIGRIFPGDSVKVELFDQTPDSLISVGHILVPNFKLLQTVYFTWKPQIAGIHQLKVEINSDSRLYEEDLSDNNSFASFTVFDLDNPSIVYPTNGAELNRDSVNFLIVDVGEFLEKNLEYYFEIDTSISFNNPITSPGIISNKFGEVKWKAAQLAENVYFWRSRIKDAVNYSNWSDVRTFSVRSQLVENNSYFSEKQFYLFENDNMVYSDSLRALFLNKEALPPKPENETYVETVEITLPDSLQSLTAIANDGQYIYAGHVGFYGLVDPNFSEASLIHKFGTGFGETVKGEYYGLVSTTALPIWKQIFYYDGGVYIATNDAFNLIRMDTQTGDTASIHIPEGMMEENGRTQDGAFYVNSDGRYVYNLSKRDTLGNQKYKLRILDPENNWNRVGADVYLSGTSYIGFSSFFLSNGYLYAYEKNISGFMRYFSLDSYSLIDEWVTYRPYKGYFAWDYDRVNDVVYSTVFVNGDTSYHPSISFYSGTYSQSFGSSVSPEIGPAKSWDNLSYGIDGQGSLGDYRVKLEGKNQLTSSWDSLMADFPQSISLQGIDANVYRNLRTTLSFVDSTTGGSLPLKLKYLDFEFESFPEVVLSRNYLTFADSLIRGFPVIMKVDLKNVGLSNAENVKVDYFLNQADSNLASRTLAIPKDSIVSIEYDINTFGLLFTNSMQVLAKTIGPESFTFNNLISDSFFVARDSVKPEFQITFDGLEIIDGDIISATPQIFMSLKDNSPLPLDTNHFSISLNLNSVSFSRDSLQFSYTPYPNSEAQINWRPRLIDGRHNLVISAHDSSGNFFFDSTAYNVSFKVASENEVLDIYNYPNPFADDTYFTFTITGSVLPDELSVKIYTVAGRLIRDFEIPVEQVNFGFNKYYWDGRDQDGNNIANGVYFYKFTSVNNGESVSELKKLAKIK